MSERPLIAHVVFRFDTGGLENGVVNLINCMPKDAYRHAVIALTEITDFRKRIARDDVDFFALNKPPGHAFQIYPALFRLFRKLQPSIVHTRNLGALEATLPAWFAGVPVCVHGEHGRDIEDMHGTKKKYHWIRRIYSPFVKHYIALSKDLEHYLTYPVGIAAKRVTQIYNGVDASRFHPSPKRQEIAGSPFNHPEFWIIGTAGRMQAIKDQTNLAKAFVMAMEQAPSLRSRLRLIMVGDGPLRQCSSDILNAAGLSDCAWLPGERTDIPDIMRGLDCFVLPSLGEGVSNTILEAMASGLPVIATAVGGNTELVVENQTGHLVPPADPAALAKAIVEMANASENAEIMGDNARSMVEKHYSLSAMVRNYQQIYDRLLFQRTRQLASR